MAETAPGRCSWAVYPVARVSGLLVACMLTKRSIAEINIWDLSACSGGFEIPNGTPNPIFEANGSNGQTMVGEIHGQKTVENEQTVDGAGIVKRAQNHGQTVKRTKSRTDGQTVKRAKSRTDGQTWD